MNECVVGFGGQVWEIAEFTPAYRNYVQADSVKFFDNSIAAQAVWYHATTSEDWHSSVCAPKDRPLVHVGTKKAAMERMRQMKSHYGHKNWTLYAVRLNDPAALAPFVVGDDNSEAPETVGVLKDFAACGYSRATRYVNEYEETGSVSLLVDPALLTVVDVQAVS